MKSIEKYIQEIQAQNGRRFIEEQMKRIKQMEREIDPIILRIEKKTADYTEEDEKDDEE